MTNLSVPVWKPADRPFFLVLSLSELPVSIDDLVTWGLARPAELWRLLDEGRSRGLITEDRSEGPGRFVWNNAALRDKLWADTSIEDWHRALVHPAIISLALTMARKAISDQDFKRASELFRGLVRGAEPDIYPGGRAEFLAVVLEGCVLSSRSDWLDMEAIDRAYSVAVESGNRRAQAILAGLLRGNLLTVSGDLKGAREQLELARDIASGLDDPVMLKGSRVGLAVNYVLSGDLLRGIAAFEESLGDIPEEVLPAVGDMYSGKGTLSMEVVGVMAMAYVFVGQPTRAIDLLHRVVALGIRTGREDWTNYGRMCLGLTGIAYGDMTTARQWGRSVFRYFRDDGKQPVFIWYSSILLAALCRDEERPDEARQVLQAGHDARLKARSPHFFARDLLDVLEWLEQHGIPPIEGLTLQGEIDRILSWGDSRMHGIGHYFAARILRSGSQPRDDARVDGHLTESERLLRETGAMPDLAKTLLARADLEESRGRAEPALAARREAQEILAAIPLIAKPSETPGLASRVLELGRLSTLGQHENVWGELAARICSQLGSERCVIIESLEAPRLLAVRGGSRLWVDALLAVLRRGNVKEVRYSTPPWNQDDQDEDGLLLVIPFGSRSFKREGLVCLENRHTPPPIGRNDRAIAEALGTQFSILMENASLWHEFQRAHARLEQENRYYRQNVRAEISGKTMVGHSPVIQQVLELVSRVAPTNTTVLINGETGVGKELVAREIHELSTRRQGPFVTVHIASMSPGLVASGLFGHERGAFTGATEQVRGRFELADGGTLFLDEVGELGPEEQVRILRVLEEGTFERVGGTKSLHSDFRLIAATNRNLEREVGAGRFREDLYFRLNVFPVRVPPLRDRLEDVPTLALFFLERVGRKLGRQFEGISEADMQQLMTYSWPGNVRELEHVIERAAVLSEPPRLRIPPIAADQPAPLGAFAPGGKWPTLEQIERQYLLSVVEHVKGRITGAKGAAAIVGLKPSTLYWRLEKLGLRASLARFRNRK